nr:MBL fold metallo-hydrolase [Micromonospora provocatoris]
MRAGDGPVTLVDAGIGPADSMAASWAPVPGRLPAELAAAGIDPADVRTVVLTHLHTDHVGWAGPLFPNADHLIQRAEVDALELFHPELPARLLTPLRAAGRLRVVDGDGRELGAGAGPPAGRAGRRRDRPGRRTPPWSSPTCTPTTWAGPARCSRTPTT